MTTIDQHHQKALLAALGEPGYALLERFMQSLDGRLGLLKDAHRNSEWDALARHAHSLKGAAGTFGACALAEMAGTLEHAAQAQNAPLLQSLVDTLGPLVRLSVAESTALLQNKAP